MSSVERPKRCGSTRKWQLPALCALIGIVYLVAGLLGGQPGFAIGGLVIMWVFGAVLLLARGRSETVTGLTDGRDERINSINLQASSLAGGVAIVGVLVAFVVNVAQGGDGEPYDWIAAAAGLTYLGAVLVGRFRG